MKITNSDSALVKYTLYTIKFKTTFLLLANSYIIATKYMHMWLSEQKPAHSLEITPILPLQCIICSFVFNRVAITLLLQTDCISHQLGKIGGTCMCMVFAPNSHLLYVASANAWERQQKIVPL